MNLFNSATQEDSWPGALLKTGNPRFQRGFMRQTWDQFRKGINHIHSQNTANGTIILVPGLGCSPSTLQVLQSVLIRIVGQKYNIVFSNPHKPTFLNNTATVEVLGSHYRTAIARILKQYEKNGNGIILTHSHGGSATIAALSMKDEGVEVLPGNLHIEMLAPSLGKVGLAGIPLTRILGALYDLRKERVFTERQIEEFLKNIDSVNVTITQSDSLVPEKSQHLITPGIQEVLAKKATKVLRPWDHLDAVNGTQVETFATEVVERIEGKR